MNFQDQWATNEAGQEFIFTVEMQRQLSEAGLPVEPASLEQLPQAQTAPPPTKPAPVQDSFSHEDSHPTAPDNPTQPIEEPDSIQIDPQTGKYIGRLKWFNATKGYGFIARGGGEDIFFHKSDAICTEEVLQDGAWILYDVEETQKGLEASDVELYEAL